jgi:LysM repeat protein
MIALLIISTVSAAFGEDYLVYAPRPVAETEKGALTVGKEELLVRKVLIKKGDTLSRLSRKYSGRASYYSQILLFNEINNPDLIYAGDTLKLPVGRLQRADEAVRPVTSVKEEQIEEKTVITAEPVESIGSKKQKSSRKKRGSKKSAEKEKKKTLQPKQVIIPSVKPPTDPGKSVDSAPPVNAEKAQKALFDQAVDAYRQNDCVKAMELFDRFLTENSTSSLAAEASLLKAECMLKLSGTP